MEAKPGGDIGANDTDKGKENGKWGRTFIIFWQVAAS